MVRYDPYTDSFIDNSTKEVTATNNLDALSKPIIQRNVVEVTDASIEKIADAVVRKLADRKDEPTISKMEQVDKPTTQTETQNSNLTFEKDECAKEYEELGLKELKELIEADRKDEPKPSCQRCKHWNGNDGCDVMTSATAKCKYEPQTSCKTCRYGEVDEGYVRCAYYSKSTEQDEPQTDDKHAVCTGCDYYDLPNAFHPCASCVDFSKYKPKIEDEPQTDVYDYKGNGKWERSE